MRYITIRTHKVALTDEQKQALAQGFERVLDTVIQDDEPNWLVFEHSGGNAIQLDQIDDSVIEGQQQTHSDTQDSKIHQVKTFSYHSDFDGLGIITYLAGGLQHYRNPAETGLINVSSSTLASDSKPASAIIGNAVVRCVTAPKINAWFMIDFNMRAIAPSHYSLRHYSSWDTEALRTWTFEASIDGQNWVILSSHVNDASLNAKGATHTWTLPMNSTPVFYRYFRVMQRGLNSNRHHYMALSGFEIYGQMQEPLSAPVSEKQTAANISLEKMPSKNIGRMFSSLKKTS